ncbi:MAG: sensor hybrid histidine kinase [Herbinix sp.]|jgi:CheY-like chemotaxis protein|nr:sensor hybrid histidine kinase [Herbinix sp.]
MKDSDQMKKDKPHVLFIDDAEYLVKIWKHVIMGWGYNVTCYTSGLEALEEFRRRPQYYDIVITDQSMPEITGFELTDEIIKIRSDMKIIICSGFIGYISSDIRNKVSDILLKPIDRETLLEAIQRSLL